MFQRSSTIDKIGVMTLSFWLSAMPVLAATDYSSMTTEELSSLRGTMREAAPEEHEAFRSAWQTRLNSMTMEERQEYTGRPAAAEEERMRNQDKIGGPANCRCCVKGRMGR